METELWPNLLFGCRDRGIPGYILNARLSERSLRGYRVLAPLVGRALRTVRTVAAQSQADGQRFIAAGRARRRRLVDRQPQVRRRRAGGSAGVRRALPRALRRQRPVWIAASTHEDEEAAVHRDPSPPARALPELLLLWAPRHPERFRAVAEHARARRLAGVDAFARALAAGRTTRCS